MGIRPLAHARPCAVHINVGNTNNVKCARGDDSRSDAAACGDTAGRSRAAEQLPPGAAPHPATKPVRVDPKRTASPVADPHGMQACATNRRFNVVV